mmetsp:Transcript_14052/g.42531  ORF Transcript_14052/g.42531 Transcript_14052/m.42531 type:complete len:258 (+) Transcript_14052:1885-2658(+)
MRTGSYRARSLAPQPRGARRRGRRSRPRRRRHPGLHDLGAGLGGRQRHCAHRRLARGRVCVAGAAHSARPGPRGGSRRHVAVRSPGADLPPLGAPPAHPRLARRRLCPRLFAPGRHRRSEEAISATRVRSSHDRRLPRASGTEPDSPGVHARGHEGDEGGPTPPGQRRRGRAQLAPGRAQRAGWQSGQASPGLRTPGPCVRRGCLPHTQGGGARTRRWPSNREGRPKGRGSSACLRGRGARGGGGGHARERRRAGSA